VDLSSEKKRLNDLESELGQQPVSEFAEFPTPYGRFKVSVTERLRQKCKKGRVWKTSGMCTALKNAEYGFDPKSPRSRGGFDGIFSVDRNYRPKNSMIKKLYDQFLDKPDPLVEELEIVLGESSDKWVAARLVSHHMRLLGVISVGVQRSHMVLVDYDKEKGS